MFKAESNWQIEFLKVPTLKTHFSKGPKKDIFLDKKKEKVVQCTILIESAEKTSIYSFAGALILDDCDTDTYGLEQAVDFIKGKIKRPRSQMAS